MHGGERLNGSRERVWGVAAVSDPGNQGVRELVQHHFSAFYARRRLEPLAFARREFGFGWEDKIE